MKTRNSYIRMLDGGAARYIPETNSWIIDDVDSLYPKCMQEFNYRDELPRICGGCKNNTGHCGFLAEIKERYSSLEIDIEELENDEEYNSSWPGMLQHLKRMRHRMVCTHREEK